MYFDFVYKEKIEEALEGSKYSSEDANEFNAIYSYSPVEFIWVNLSAKVYKRKPVESIMERICMSLHHEYLHKAIRNMEQELGLVEKYEETGRMKEEEIISEIVGEKFDKERYEKVL